MSDPAAQPNPYRKLVEKAFAEAIPLSCQFEITYRCNHECTFCYNSPTGERELSTEQIFEALRKIADFGVLYLTLTGGEVLCHKDFFAIAADIISKHRIIPGLKSIIDVGADALKICGARGIIPNGG